MGIRKGILLGFLVGSAAASALVKARKAEAPTQGSLAPGAVEPDAEKMVAPLDLKGTLEKVKRHAEEAIDAAHEAQAEKEAELRRQFDELRRKQT